MSKIGKSKRLSKQDKFKLALSLAELSPSLFIFNRWVESVCFVPLVMMANTILDNYHKQIFYTIQENSYKNTPISKTTMQQNKNNHKTNVFLLLVCWFIRKCFKKPFPTFLLTIHNVFIVFYNISCPAFIKVPSFPFQIRMSKSNLIHIC